MNRTPLTTETNRHVINDRLPNEYLREAVEASGESTVRGILESHLISPAAFDILLRDPFTPGDFETFIAERQRTIRDAIEDLLIKDRLALPPNLRALDSRIETVELGIRDVIAGTLEGTWERVPPHVAQKVQERVQREQRKDPSYDTDRYASLAGRLEFFDLRELQDTITNRSLWNAFEPRFQNKDALVAKFGQLADLRNAVRHSRGANEVMTKEGEAAIIWFERMLGARCRTFDQRD